MTCPSPSLRSPQPLPPIPPTPATQASRLFLPHARHRPAPGPLHRPSPPPRVPFHQTPTELPPHLLRAFARKAPLSMGAPLSTPFKIHLQSRPPDRPGASITLSAFAQSESLLIADSATPLLREGELCPLTSRWIPAYGGAAGTRRRSRTAVQPDFGRPLGPASPRGLWAGGSCAPLPTHSFIEQYVLSTYCMPGRMVSDLGDMLLTTADSVPTLTGLTAL